MTHGVTISPVDVAQRQEMDIRQGDTLKVWQRIVEGVDKKTGKPKVRLQLFEGLVLARKHGREAGGTITVRKVSNGVGIEKTFPLYSPMIEKMEVSRRAKVRRAKLYYIREKVAREAKRKLRRLVNTPIMPEPTPVAEASPVEEVAEETAAK